MIAIDGKTLVTAGRDLRFWDVAPGRLLRTIPVGSPRDGNSATAVARSWRRTSPS